MNKFNIQWIYRFCAQKKDAERNNISRPLEFIISIFKQTKIATMKKQQGTKNMRFLMELYLDDDLSSLFCAFNFLSQTYTYISALYRPMTGNRRAGPGRRHGRQNGVSTTDARHMRPHWTPEQRHVTWCPAHAAACATRLPDMVLRNLFIFAPLRSFTSVWRLTRGDDSRACCPPKTATPSSDEQY